ncbi:MAG: hypothetical protein GY711_25850 [bacterium]|nr:hypothetical protein [bacterium]
MDRGPSRPYRERAAELLDRPVSGVVAALPMYHHVRGSLLETAGRGEDAVRAYERAPQLDPDAAVSATNLGSLLGQLGHADEGLRVLDDLLEASRGNPTAARALEEEAHALDPHLRAGR